MYFGPYDFVQIPQACGTHIVLKNVWRDFRFSMSALATVKQNSFKGKFTAEINFPDRVFMLSLLMQALKVKSVFIHYLIRIWITCWWNLNKIVWSDLHKILRFMTKKWFTIFDKALTPF